MTAAYSSTRFARESRERRSIYVDRRSAAVEARGHCGAGVEGTACHRCRLQRVAAWPAEIAATSASGLAAQGSAGIFRNILDTAGDKTVVLALGSPYSILNFPSSRSYLCTYSWVPTSERSAAKALFGEIPIHGKLPVTLAGHCETRRRNRKEAATSSNALTMLSK